ISAQPGSTEAIALADAPAVLDHNDLPQAASVIAAVTSAIDRVLKHAITLAPSAVTLHVGEDLLIEPRYAVGNPLDHHVRGPSSAPAFVAVTPQVSVRYPGLGYSALAVAQSAETAQLKFIEGAKSATATVTVIKSTNIAAPEPISPADQTI